MLTKLVVILGLSLATSFLCSILEAVLLSVTQGYVHVLKDKGSKAGKILDQMQRRIDEPIAAILALNTIANTFGAALGGALALQLFGDVWMAVFSAALTLAILLFSEILPKTLGATLWPRLAPSAAYVLRALVFILKPVIVPLTFYSRLITAGQERPSTISRAELGALARIGLREGALEEDEWRVVSSLMSLDQVPIGEIMTPRTDMIAVPLESTVKEAMTVMLDEGHLRMPVYEGTMDRVVGILLARDLWGADRDGKTSFVEIIRPAVFSPATKAVDALTREMRGEQVKMVIVVDEFGGTRGLVTLEDLLEELVGEIQDEHELDEPQGFHTLENGRVRIWGGVALREVCDTLRIDLPDDLFDTIGGFVFGQLRRIPKVGDRVAAEGGEFRVERMNGRRVEFVDFHRQEKE
jgi:CBS domain containing-hemolysin-like protein